MAIDRSSLRADREAFVEAELLLEAFASEPERALAARRQIGLEEFDVARNRVPGLRRRIGEIAKQVEVAEIGEGPGQVVVNETQRPAQALEADLHENPGRILDIVAGGLHQARHLSQLGVHAPGALGERRVVEERLPGEAGGERVGKELRAALEGADLFELEKAGADARFERRPLEPFDIGQARGIDGRKPAGKAAERPDLRVDSRPAEVLEEIVVDVNAVEGRRRGVDLVEIRQVFVNEVRKGFG